jgi:hypothetical protein
MLPAFPHLLGLDMKLFFITPQVKYVFFLVRLKVRSQTLPTSFHYIILSSPSVFRRFLPHCVIWHVFPILFFSPLFLFHVFLFCYKSPTLSLSDYSFRARHTASRLDCTVSTVGLSIVVSTVAVARTGRSCCSI